MKTHFFQPEISSCTPHGILKIISSVTFKRRDTLANQKPGDEQNLHVSWKYLNKTTTVMQRKVVSYMRGDSEVELLLNIALEYEGS